MTRRYKQKSLSGIPLLAASFLLVAIPPVCAQQASSEIFSSQKVVYAQKDNQEIRDIVDKQLPQMERRLIGIEQKINQIATAQTANIPPMNVGGMPGSPGSQATASVPMPTPGTTLGAPVQNPQTGASQTTGGDALLEELYGEEGQDAIPAELQALLSFDPSEVSLEGATFVGCVNDQAMFRGADSKPFFVPATYALNHEAVRLIGGCSQ